ncbi:hypothetical protein ACGFYO_16965 [Streptomyces sp. NPDC048201]|uniref:hypothetical protein n=1 Tax=Streptomyces sp. NPDC048201 TaxID=3365513 RepID=UPI00371F0A75
MPVNQAPRGALQLKWELRDHGWARCHLANDSHQASLSVSYCTDALADLVAAAGRLYGQQRTTRFFFDAEPQELRWVLRATDVLIDVTIYEFPDVSVSLGLPDTAGTVIWQSAHSRRLFSHAVLNAAQNVFIEHGEAGYQAKWMLYPFPVALVQDLRRLHLRDDACALPHDHARP